MKIKITADSTADIPQEICDRFDIELIPLSVSLGDNIYWDGVDINPEMIYDYVLKTKQLPKTSAINTEMYREKFEKILNNGYDAIIHFNISSEMSTTHRNAQLLMEDMKNLYVIDSQTLSTGIALQAIYASELASSGKYEIEEIVKKVEERRDFCQTSFVLDKLQYLYRGGRCSAIALFGANLLKIKPSIEVHNYKMGVGKKYFGKFDSCVLKYVKDILQRYNNPDTTRIFVTHTKIDPEIVESVKEYIRQNTQFKEILETTAGATVTSHCGSNTIGILFFADGDGHY